MMGTTRADRPLLLRQIAWALWHLHVVARRSEWLLITCSIERSTHCLPDLLRVIGRRMHRPIITMAVIL
jgi:hypothetical protein